MDKQEYFLLLPAIIYGVAIVDLLKILRHKNGYAEMIAWGFFLMVYAVIVWQELYTKLAIVANNSLFFVFMVVKAVVLAQLAAVITPEQKGKDTKKYFLKVRKKFFFLAAFITILNLIEQEFLFADDRPLYLRGTTILIFLSCALIDKVWLRWLSWTIITGMLFYILGQIFYASQ